jgi:serine-type D-Ala-D-Ala carboxypeptidase/endopeptidase
LGPTGDLRSTADDLLAFLEMVMGLRPSPLDAAQSMMLDKLRPTGDPRTRIGLGWRITDLDGHVTVWSNGSADGYRSYIGYSPARHIGVVALANAGTAQGADDIAQHVIDPYYPVNLQTPRDHTEITLSEAVLDRYVGDYRFEDDYVLSIKANAGHLIGQMTGQGSFDLYAESEQGFFMKDADAQITFEYAGSGRAGALTLHQNGQHFRAARLP